MSEDCKGILGSPQEEHCVRVIVQKPYQQGAPPCSLSCVEIIVGYCWGVLHLHSGQVCVQTADKELQKRQSPDGICYTLNCKDLEFM